MKKTIRVWDVPTRVFHWTFAACIVASLVSGIVAGGWVVWHERFGYAALALLLFRLIWGVVGSETSRFTDFLRAPKTLFHYLKTGESPTQGHNPLGGFSVLAMLALVFVQAATGLILDDEIANKGPLADKVPAAWVTLATTVHRINKTFLIILVIAHVCAIIFYTYKKKHSLVKPMLFGEREVDERIVQPRMASAPMALGILVLCAVFVYWLVKVFPK